MFLKIILKNTNQTETALDVLKPLYTTFCHLHPSSSMWHVYATYKLIKIKISSQEVILNKKNHRNYNKIFIEKNKKITLSYKLGDYLVILNFLSIDA